jgi:predicted RND superfamily exporter protein
VDRIARLIVDHSRQILAATALISLFSVAMLFRMDFNADVASFVLEGNDTGETFSALQDKYATADPINVIASLDEGSFRTKDGLVKLVLLRDQLAAVEGVEAVASIVPESNPITGAPLTAGDIGFAPEAAISELLEQNPVSHLLLDDEGQNTLLLVIPGDDPLSAARKVGDITPPSGITLTLSGNPVVFATVLDVLSLFLLIIPPIVIALLVGTFYATIGDLRLSVLAILPAALGSLWTFGLIFGLGREVDIVTVIVPIFVIVMGSADGLHFVTHFQEETDAETVGRVRSALREVGTPMILTTISTAAGFLSLLITDVQPIRQLGLFTAIGIVFAGIISFFALPALISRLEVEPKHQSALLGPRLTRGLKALVRTRTPAIVLTLGILAFAAVFVPQLEVDSDQLFFFKDDDPIRQAFEKTEDLFGGATPLVGEFVFDPSAGPEQLAEIRAASDALEQQSGIREVFSIADLADALPPEQLNAVLSEQIALPLGDMVSDDGLRFLVFPADFTTDDLQSWLTFAEESDQIRVLTGMPIVWDEIARLVLQAQIGSVIVAYTLVAAMLLLAYRRLWETVVSLVPITLTIVTVLGFLAASGIQLNLLTAVISSIVIGVGIDYAIHYVAAVDYARPAGDGYVLRAIDRAGRPIVANALGIAIALSALWLSPLKIHSQVSMIMWVAMITAALTALLVIPAMLPRAGVRDPEREQPEEAPQPA